MSDTPAVLADGAALDGPTLDRAAAWLAAMDADYYSLFDLPPTRVEAILAGCLRDPSSEFGTAAILLHGGEAAGLLCAFPAEEMFGRRMQVLWGLLAAAPDPPAAWAARTAVATWRRAWPPRAGPPSATSTNRCCAA